MVEETTGGNTAGVGEVSSTGSEQLGGAGFTPVMPSEGLTPEAAERSEPAESVEPVESAPIDAPTETSVAEKPEEESLEAEEEKFGEETQKEAMEEQVDAIFADLDRIVHGSSEEMVAQQNEILSVKIKIKRLLA